MCFWGTQLVTLIHKSPGDPVRLVYSYGGYDPGYPGQESDGLVLLVPGVQAGCVFLGSQLGTLIRESPGDLV